MSPRAGIFILGALRGAAVDQIHAITQRYDPKLANARSPHITLAGSSGVGPIPWNTSVTTLRQHLEPIAATTAPISLTFLPPHRFLQTEIIVLPVDPHGPIRVLHDRIASSGLPFETPRFTFSPHVTLTLYRTLTHQTAQELLRLRITEPVVLDTLHVYYTSEPAPARLLLELPLNKTAE